MGAAEVGWGHPHQQPAVAVLPVPGPSAHAVGHQPSGFGGGGHHLAAGADAEGEGRAAVGQVAGQLVVRRGQLFPGGAELGQTDVGLPVLDAHADGKGLLLHGDPGLEEHPEGVPGGVAGGQHQGVGLQVVGPPGGGHGETGQPAVLLPQAGEPVLEPDVTAPGQQLGPDALHHLAEHVGADVGLVGPEDVLRRAVLHQGLQHGGDAAVVGARGQLAVGKGACATLPELDVGERVQHPGGPEGGHVGGALFHRVAPL